MSLDDIRAHVTAWRGLNHDDAAQLLDLLDEAGANVEYAVPTYEGAEPATTQAGEVVFVGQTDAVWARVVGPWRAV